LDDVLISFFICLAFNENSLITWQRPNWQPELSYAEWSIAGCGVNAMGC
jgi:hypothetical protein